ncbi:DnaJ domain-containing protein [Hyphococcus sp.]|jgi:4-amino-4-deoxy-L-arabinose transferase-like glycosyltransferase|uniref:DnaJ domain-containing protein n=1 Tax=Hyphococcus sp. TaxID=2038636 RepID=UPI003D1169C7
MSLGLIALFLAFAAAGWLLFRLGGNRQAGGERSMTIMKFVVLLVLTAALLAAKLWPLAFMVLLAVGGVTAIEAWRARAGPSETDEAPPSPPARRMSEEEALSILGLKSGASAEDVRAAYRRLMSQLHPDKGGTDYLAAKINEARDHLLRKLGD